MRPTAIGVFGGSQKVLVCDDERHIVRLLQVNFGRQGHKVVCAFNGRQAVEELEKADGVHEPVFDAIILDAMMPYMDGYEVIKWIRTHDHTRGAWVTLMTANVPDDDFLDSWPYKADRYLKKPFNPMEVLRQ